MLIDAKDIAAELQLARPYGMSDLRKAAQAALDALELSAPDVRHANYAQTWDAIHGLRAALAQPQAEPAIDCRTCRHYTTASGGCLSVIKCVDGVAYQRAGIRQYWRDGNLTG